MWITVQIFGCQSAQSAHIYPFLRKEKLKNIPAETQSLESHEINIGKSLISIFTKYENLYTNKNFYLGLNTNDLPDHLKIFQNFFETYKEIILVKNFKSFDKSCPFVLLLPENNTFQIKIKGSLKYLCYRIFLDLSLKSKDQTHFFNIKNSTFLVSGLNYYQKYKILSDKFIILLKKISQNKLVKKLLQKKINNYYNTNNLIPDKSILTYISPSHLIKKRIKLSSSQENIKSSNTYKKIKKLMRKLNDYKIQDAKKAENLAQTIVHFIKLNQKKWPKSIIIRLLHNLGHDLKEFKIYSLAIKVFKFNKKLTTGIEKQNNIYNILWCYYLNKQFRKIIDYYHNLPPLEKTNLLIKSRFWIANSLEKINKHELAHDIYKEIINENPLNYYSILSSRKISLLKKDHSKLATQGSYQLMMNRVKINEISSNFLSKKVKHSLTRLNLWAQLKSSYLISLETKYNNQIPLEELASSNNMLPNLIIKESISYMISQILTTTGNYLSNFKYMHNLISKKIIKPNFAMLPTLFPNPYTKQIKILENDIDPLIITSLIRQESAFNPKARSRVGALGLMQIMPLTAKQIIKGIKKHRLKNPRVNLKIGIRYLKYLLKKYNGNLIYALAAYNAGEHNVKKWITKGLLVDSIPHQIENIPFRETRNYVKLIFRNYFFYKLIDQKKVTDQLISKIQNINSFARAVF